MDWPLYYFLWVQKIDNTLFQKSCTLIKGMNTLKATEENSERFEYRTKIYTQKIINTA